ncbi:TetR/AcrR family transcriptional regulator [Nonomuraea sp. NPDC050536]|uniref:TetR/AcrR family transcriptional regulator n=1 Tax=Nonomuraea sp. NPDC050536 TaxID=3364366 RepID=UPI0037C9D216
MTNVWMRPEEPARGPRPSFSRAQLTEAAIRVADAEGLKAISMRRVAAEIGSGTMSLYRYVSSKDDLIDLMLDAVAVEYLPDEVSGDWRADLRGLAVRSRQVMLRHPWIAPLTVGRQTAGPNRIRVMEAALRTVDGLGVSIDGMLTMVGTVSAFVSGFVSSELAEIEASRQTGVDLGQWLMRQAPFIESVLKSGDYPLFTRMTKEGARRYVDSEERFFYGLDRVLDGLAARLPD